MDIKLIAYIGIFVLFAANIAALMKPGGGRYAGFPNPLALISLFAGLCFVYYFMNHE